MQQLQAFLAGETGVYAFLGAIAIALIGILMGLRGRGGGGSAGGGNELRAAQSQVKLLRGDLMQANKELESLKAVQGGRMPPEFEQYRRRAEEADAEIRKLKEAHGKEVEALKELIPEDDSLGQTIIAPSTASMHEEIESLRGELESAKTELAGIGATHQQAINDLTGRFTAEKAAALTALEQRHAAAIEALRKQAGLSESIAASAVAAAVAADVDASGGPDPAALPWLEILTGEQQGTRIVLPFSNSTLGRSDSASIPLDEPRASRNHAEIRFDGTGFAIADLNSTNGTIVNGKPVSQSELVFGDTIEIGDLELRFSCAAAEAFETDPERAAGLLEAMLRMAPGYTAVADALNRLRG